MSYRFSPVTTHLKAGLAATVVATLAAVVLSVGVATPAAGAATAAKASTTPCWKLLLNDWYDGRIDQTYAIHCYRDALKHLPSDVQTYSSAHDDILRALQTAITQEKKSGKKVGNDTLVVPPKPPKGTGKGGKGGEGTTTTGTTTSGPGRKGDGGIAGGLNSSSPSSLPVPLLVLGGLALLLVAAGAAGLIAKRIQSRRANP
jgi:hypothetical protein